MPRSAFNVLVLSDFNGLDANVIRDFLYSFNRHSQHRFFYLHAWRNNHFRRMRNFDFNGFDAIVLFWDFFWIGSNDPLSYCYIPDWVADPIAASPALKIQFLQDEYRDVRLANRVMKRLGVNVMFSCVAPKDHETFYPKALIPSLEATYPVLTGYVPSYLETVDWPASIDRPIDIGYRSRQNPYYLGSLAQEKCVIAEQFQKIADAHDFRANISVREEDRIYGDDWLTFQRSCRFSLGTESGASVVDFDGTIKKNCQEYLRDHPGASFAEVKKLFFADVDGKVCVQTISPRIFEASAFENTLVLHEGHYEGMIEPDVDYISVKKDYSNFAEVVAKMRDRDFCMRLARSAKEKLILSKRYNYQSFVQQFDQVLAQHVRTPKRTKEASRTVFYFMNYINSDRLVPRRDALVRVPHWLDLIALAGKKALHLTTVFHSVCAMIVLLAQAPALKTLILTKMRARSVSWLGLLKDLRILTLLRLHRQSKKLIPALPFEVQLRSGAHENRLELRSVPAAKDGAPDYDAATVAREKTSLASDLDRSTDFTMIWDHHLVGDTLLLPGEGSCNYEIFLNLEGVWRFDSFQQACQAGNADERRAALTELLFPGQSMADWLQPAVVVVQLIWALVLLVGTKSLDVVRRGLAPVLNFAAAKRPPEAIPIARLAIDDPDEGERSREAAA